MANEIQSVFNSVYSDGPSSNPTEPVKSRIRDEVGGTIQAKVDSLQAGVEEAKAIAVTGRKTLDNVIFRSTSTGALATAFLNGTTHDGRVAATGERFFMDGRTDPKENGIYLVPASGSPVRTTDADTGAELLGATFYVAAGTTSKGKTYTCKNLTAPVVGTDAILFALVNEQNTAIPSALDGLRAKGANIASAATVDLSTATGDVITVTGTTAITSFGTMAAGVERTIIATAELPIIASANIVTPSGFNLTLSAKDALTLKSLGSGAWQVVSGITGPTITQKADLSEPGIRTDKTGFIIRPLVYGSKDGVTHFPQKEWVPADMDYPDTHVDPTGFRIPTRAEAMIAAGAGGGGSGSAGWGQAYWAAQDAAGAAYSAAVAYRPIPDVAGFFWDYNLVFAYGQSRSVGGVSHPAKTITPPAWGITAKSVGTSVGSSDESNLFVPFGAIGDPSIGSFTLQPLIGTVDIDDPGGGRREDPITFAGEVTSGLGGERPIVGFTYSFHRLWNETRGELTGNYGNRIPIAASQGFGGQTLEDLLSDSNIPSHPFSTKKRAESFCGQLRSYVTGTLGKTVGLAACTFWQGEANASNDYATMIGLLGGLKTFLQTNLAGSIFSQTKTPIIIITQVTEHWTVDKPAVPQAQNDFALANADVFISAPSYATPGKMEIPSDGVSMPTALNEHKDGNGSRWHGEYDAKVAHQILVLRRYWEHMHLIKGTFKAGDNRVLLTWHTPSGKIKDRPCYIGYRTAVLSNWGIVIKQNGSELSLVGKQIYGTNSVLLTLDGVLATGLPTTVEYAISDGRGNIWDSDPAVGRFTYDSHIRDYASSTPISGDMTAQEIAIQAEVDANLGHLYGKPYPLFNAAAAEVFTLTEITE